MKGFTTKLVHGNRNITNQYGALRTPVYNNAAFDFENSQMISDVFMGKIIAPSYSRTSNPSISELEQKFNLMAGAVGSLAVSSGMAAITNTIITIGECGDNIITTKYLFGNTISFFDNTFKHWGLDIRYADFSKPEELEKLIDSKTRAIFLETISNPQMTVYDIEKIGKIANERKILLIVDNTLTTPYLFDSKKFGVNIEIMSTTKYVSGGGTSVGGVIIDYGTYDWSHVPKFKDLVEKHGNMSFMWKIKREVYRNMGACISPENAYLQSLGLETMALRIDRSCENTQKIAEFLQKLPGVKKVSYPGLKTDPYYGLAKKIFNGKYGGVLTFELESKEKCFEFMDKLKIIRRATNMNDNKSLIIHPSSTIFSDFTEEEKEDLGVSSRLIRLSVGIEDVIDLMEDLEQAAK